MQPVILQGISNSKLKYGELTFHKKETKMFTEKQSKQKIDGLPRFRLRKKRKSRVSKKIGILTPNTHYCLTKYSSQNDSVHDYLNKG